MRERIRAKKNVEEKKTMLKRERDKESERERKKVVSKGRQRGS